MFQVSITSRRITTEAEKHRKRQALGLRPTFCGTENQWAGVETTQTELGPVLRRAWATSEFAAWRNELKVTIQPGKPGIYITRENTLHLGRVNFCLVNLFGSALPFRFLFFLSRICIILVLLHF